MSIGVTHRLAAQGKYRLARIDRRGGGRRHGFTLIELLVVIGIVAILSGLVLAAVSHARKSASTTQCLLNLRQISAAFQQYTMDNSDCFPTPLKSQTSWEHLLRRYLPDVEVFRCGSDEEIFPALGSSYDWRDTPRPETTLAGKSLSSIRRLDAVLAFEALPGWHSQQKINAGKVDGSVETMDREQCLGDLKVPLH